MEWERERQRGRQLEREREIAFNKILHWEKDLECELLLLALEQERESVLQRRKKVPKPRREGGGIGEPNNSASGRHSRRNRGSERERGRGASSSGKHRKHRRRSREKGPMLGMGRPTDNNLGGMRERTAVSLQTPILQGGQPFGPVAPGAGGQGGGLDAQPHTFCGLNHQLNPNHLAVASVPTLNGVCGGNTSDQMLQNVNSTSCSTQMQLQDQSCNDNEMNNNLQNLQNQPPLTHPNAMDAAVNNPSNPNNPPFQQQLHQSTPNIPNSLNNHNQDVNSNLKKTSVFDSLSTAGLGEGIGELLSPSSSSSLMTGVSCAMDTTSDYPSNPNNPKSIFNNSPPSPPCFMAAAPPAFTNKLPTSDSSSAAPSLALSSSSSSFSKDNNNLLHKPIPMAVRNETEPFCPANDPTNPSNLNNMNAYTSGLSLSAFGRPAQQLCIPPRPSAPVYSPRSSPLLPTPTRAHNPANPDSLSQNNIFSLHNDNNNTECFNSASRLEGEIIERFKETEHMYATKGPQLR